MIDRNKTKSILAAVLLVVATVFLFARLGHYSFWDDEALVALSAKGILRTGDTTAVLDHNIVAYRQGTLLKDLHDRSTPPLPAYVTAAAFALLGESTFAGRLPLALCGLIWTVLVLRWLKKEDVSLRAWILFAVAIVGNVSLFLFFRQCRYYGITILCSTAIVYLYLNWSGRRRDIIWIAVLSIALFAANYVNYFALYGCLLVDYVVWGRKHRALNVRDWTALLIPQILACAVIFAIWNPFKTGNSAGLSSATASLKVWLMCISFVDMSACEFGVGILLLIGPIVALFVRDLWLLRSFAALVLYVAAIAVLSPQVMDEGTVHADIRYLAPLIPLCIFIGVRVVLVLTRRFEWLAYPLAIVAFGTNLLEGVTLRPFDFHSTLVRYVRELAHPPTDPFQPTAAWIRQDIPSHASVWVMPEYMTYPLMFHAPEVTYAWQLSDPPRNEFQSLPPIHFLGRVLPDYIVVFGPHMKDVTKELHKAAPAASYNQIAAIDVYWKDTYRPELYWRQFEERTLFNRDTEGVYVLKRK